MFRHCRQPSGIAARPPTCASITPAGNLTLAASSLRSSSSTTPAATTTAPITTAPTLYPRGHLLFVTHAAPASPTGPWRVRYAGLQLITAGPTGRTRDRRARLRTRRRVAGSRAALGCTAKRCSTVTHSLKRWIRECPGAEIGGSVNA